MPALPTELSKITFFKACTRAPGKIGGLVELQDGGSWTKLTGLTWLTSLTWLARLTSLVETERGSVAGKLKTFCLTGCTEDQGNACSTN